MKKVGFFSREQKKIALTCSSACLENAYHDSEKRLKNVARLGDDKMLKKAMKEHGKFEYAMLYKNTPEYQKRLSKIKSK